MITELQQTWILLMLGMGLLGVLLAWLSFFARPWHARDLPVLEYPHDHKQERYPIPPMLTALYVLTGLGMIAYVIWAMLVHPGL